MDAQAFTGEFSPANLRCWKEAINVFNQTLTGDSKKRIWLGSEDFPDIKGIKDLFATPLSAKLQYDAAKDGPSRYLHRIFKEVNKYAQVVDVFIQQQPDITAVVWGCIRFLTQVAVEEGDTGELIGDALVDIISAIGRWENYLEAFSTSPRILQSLTSLYAAIVSFLVRTRAFYQKEIKVRFAKAAFTPLKGKFVASIDLIKKRSQDLENEFRTESHILNAQSLQDVQKLQLRDSAFVAATFLLTAKIERDMSAQQQALQGVQVQLEASRKQKKVRGLIRWLETGWRISDNIAEPFEGTCQWVLEHAAYNVWVRMKFMGILWIYGILGAGKSVLSKFLSAHSTTALTITYHFRASVDWESSRPSPFVAFILSKILQHPSITAEPGFETPRKHLETLSSQFKDDSSKSPFVVLWSALLSLVQIIPDFTLIVDGLDECQVQETSELDDLLSKLELLGTATKARIIVLSQPYGRFEPYVERATLIQMNERLIDPDVILFVDAQINEDKHLVKIREQVLKRVTTGCQGMFLWAVLLMKYLKDGLTRNNKLRRLEEFPEGLYLAYESVLKVYSCRLDSEMLQLRREVLMTLLEARRALTVNEVCVALAIDPLKPQLDREDLLLDPHELLPSICLPLAEISDGHLVLVHHSVRDFLTQTRQESTTSLRLHLTINDSNSYLVRKCLLRLSEAQYRSPSRIAPVLRKNVYPESPIVDEDFFLEDTVLYEYAAANWHIHLTAIPDPENDILNLAQAFLHGNQFVMWAEYIFGKYNDNSPIAVVEGRLKPWYLNLPPSSKDKIEIYDYFKTPYRILSNVYKAEGNDNTLQWFCLYRLGSWYMMAPDLEAADKVKKEVVEGLTKLLGKTNPLTLKAVAALALNYFILGKMKSAEEMYLETSHTQLDVVGADKPDSFESLMYAAAAQYYMTQYSLSSSNQSQAAAGIWRTLGPTSTTFLTSQLFYGFALVGSGQLDPAVAIFEDIYKRRSEVLGPDNGMGLHAQVALADVLRKIGSLDKAETNLNQAYEARVRIWGIKPFTSIDTAIHLIIVYRESHKLDKAQEYIDIVSKPGILEFYFDRFCQVNHLRALIQIDTGHYEKGRDILRNLLDQSLHTGRESNNRPLLWVRLTLSTILREHGKKDEASELFEDIVETTKDPECDSLNSLDGEPQPPRLLQIAEEALRLVRGRMEREAKQLLDENGLKWKRDADFWIQTGGPAADTAWMRGP